MKLRHIVAATDESDAGRQGVRAAASKSAASPSASGPTCWSSAGSHGR